MQIIAKLHFILFRQNLQIDAYNDLNECCKSKATVASGSNLATKHFIPKEKNVKSATIVEKSPQKIKNTERKLSEEAGNVGKELIKFNYQQNPLKELQNLAKKSNLHEITVSLHYLYIFGILRQIEIYSRKRRTPMKRMRIHLRIILRHC